MSYADLHKHESLPVKNSHPPVWHEVVRRIRVEMPADAEDLIKAINARNELGFEKYGTYLQPNNGRDAQKDALQEAFDLTVYSQQAYLDAKLGVRDADFELELLDYAMTCRRLLYQAFSLYTRSRKQA